MSQHNAPLSTLELAAPLFAALGDETRLKLVSRLSASGPQSITRLATGSVITRQAITKHLTVLAAVGIVRDNRRGRERIWTLDVSRFDEAGRYLEHISQQWDEALDRLKTFVEE